MKKIIIQLALVLFGCGLLCSNGHAYEKQFIRVAVLDGATKVTLDTTGRYKILDGHTKQVIDHGRTLRKKIITVKDGEIVIGLTPSRTNHVQLIPRKYATITYNDKNLRYRGMIDLYVKENGKLLAVNDIELEKYVRGVLYHEVSDRWPLEAMKAQAVAVRTYALYRRKINEGQLFDVTNDIYSQMYGGKSAEHHRTNIAAKRTVGKIMLFDGKILPAYFHANCGGHTEDVTQLWEHDLAPLKGVECPYCFQMPSYTWKKNFQSSKIQGKLNENGFKIGLIESIEILEKNESGRIVSLAIHSRDGKIETISGKKFREIIGPNEVRSNKFDIAMKGYYFDVSGKGWGHGVGMCQWGAYAMSRKAKKYEEILSHYYPGAELVDYREPEWHVFDKKRDQ